MAAQWLSKDCVLVLQAAGCHQTQPLYAQQLWAQAEDPAAASMYLLDLLMRERVQPMGHHADTGAETGAETGADSDED